MNKIHRKAYLLCPKDFKNDGFVHILPLTDRYELRYGKDTDCSVFEKENKKIVVLGLFVHCQNPEQSDAGILEKLCDSANDMAALIEACSYLAGHFVVIFVENNSISMIPDACSTYGIAYTTEEKKMLVSSNPKIIADLLGYDEDPKALHMMLSTNPGEALPNNRTMYAAIRMLLPNNTLELGSGKIQRHFPATIAEAPPPEQIYRQSADMLRNIIQGLMRKKDLSLPLTGGIDSRTILAAIGKEQAQQIPLYTYRHEKFTLKSGDIAIPAKISADNNLNYQQIPLSVLDEETKALYRHEIDNQPEMFTPRLCRTYLDSNLKGRWFLSGGISPIGKRGYGNMLPEGFCIPSYLLTKAHGSSLEAYREVKKWAREIKPHCRQSGVSMFDMFYWEYRCGRWDQMTHLYIDAMIDMVSPYNCARLLSMWMEVPYKKRHEKIIHKKIMEILWPELLCYPMNPDARLTSLIKKYKYIYWLSSYANWMKESFVRKIRVGKNEQ